MRKKWLSLIMVITMLASMMLPMTAFAATDAEASDEITIETTLQDNLEQISSRKVFEVVAKHNGKKIRTNVFVNDKKIYKTWGDSNKDTYTLNFTEEGKYVVKIVGFKGDLKKEIIRTVNYKKAPEGTPLGYATVSLEALTLGTGFMVEPVKVEIRDGENTAQVIARVLEEHGYSFRHTGKIENSFYLSMVANGGEYDTGCQEKNDIMKQIPADPTNKVPAVLKKVLDDKGVKLNPIQYLDNNGNVIELGEFCYSYMSGWMYSLNNNFPNVGLSQTYPEDGDVIRVQFTLYGLGADIGGGYAVGGAGLTDYYKVADKTNLMRCIADFKAKEDFATLVADPEVKAAYDNAVALGEQLDASQEDVDASIEKLNAEVAAYYKEVADREAAKKVDDLIDAIGNVTLESLDDINAATEAYNSLTDDQKAYVEGFDKLQAAIKEYEALKAEADKPAEKPEADKENDKTPLTGDQNTVALYALAMIAAAGTAFAARRKYNK